MAKTAIMGLMRARRLLELAKAPEAVAQAYRRRAVVQVTKGFGRITVTLRNGTREVWLYLPRGGWRRRWRYGSNGAHAKVTRLA